MGRELTFWTIRAATLCYALAVFARLRRRESVTAGRIPWTAGCVLYLVHVALAFHFFHNWSHADAVRETARRTQEMFGIADGSGVYWNYLFTAVWTIDVFWWWTSARKYPNWLKYAIHGFMAFMFLNAVIVFGSPGMRWLGAVVLAALLVYIVKRLRSR